MILWLVSRRRGGVLVLVDVLLVNRKGSGAKLSEGGGPAGGFLVVWWVGCKKRKIRRGRGLLIVGGGGGVRVFLVFWWFLVFLW